MRVAIMQPYFLPYIGYFQLIGAVDLFVVYDQIKYTKKGWINRNRMLLNGADATFSLPLRKAADSLNIVDRQLAADFNRTKLLAQFYGAYRTAPYFDQTYPLLDALVKHDDDNLFAYLLHALRLTCAHLALRTPIQTSSKFDIDNELKAQDKVIALCKATGADSYVNAIGGVGLYDPGSFAKNNLNLHFLKSRPLTYRQFNGEFVPWLSIVDVLMFNALGVIQSKILTDYDLG